METWRDGSISGTQLPYRETWGSGTSHPHTWSVGVPQVCEISPRYHRRDMNYYEGNVEWVKGHHIQPPDPGPINWGEEVVAAIAVSHLTRLRVGLGLHGADINGHYHSGFYGSYDVGGEVGSICEGDTALHMAAREGNPQMVYLLRTKGADMARRNKRGETAADIVNTSDYSDEMRRVLAPGLSGEMHEKYHWVCQPVTKDALQRLDEVRRQRQFQREQATVRRFGDGHQEPHWKKRFIL